MKSPLRSRTIVLLVLLMAVPAWTRAQCTVDTDGADDETGQKDLTQICVTLPDVFQAYFDDTGTSGANTLDVCFYIDTDTDGNANFAICPEGTGDPSTLGGVNYFSCDDASTDCTGGSGITPVATNSACLMSSGTNPFDAGDDAVAQCTIDIGDLGVVSGQVSLVCTYPGSLASGGEDCISFETVLLPVELVLFEASLRGSEVLLTWQTASETNNAGFAVEQSDNGAPFNEITFVNGAGTTRTPQTYGFTARDISVGLHRFRLKQIDVDGAYAYSPVVEVISEVPGTHLLSEAYPNPFNPRTSFTLAVSRGQRVAVDVFDMLGRHVSSLYRGTIEANAVRTFSVEAANWTSGIYTVVVEGQAFRDSRALVLYK